MKVNCKSCCRSSVYFKGEREGYNSFVPFCCFASSQLRDHSGAVPACARPRFTNDASQPGTGVGGTDRYRLRLTNTFALSLGLLGVYLDGRMVWADLITDSYRRSCEGLCKMGETCTDSSTKLAQFIT